MATSSLVNRASTVYHPSMVPRTRGLFCTFLTVCSVAVVGATQSPAQTSRPTKVDVQKLMHHFILGRYSMPVTCTQPDGSLIEREESIVFRSAHDKAGYPVIRATFFGIDAPDAQRCYNLVRPRLLDRRGSLFVTFPAIYRPDLGVHDFRRILLRGPLEFRVISGLLQVREIGSEPETPAALVRFDDAKGKLVIADIAPQSDGDKLLRQRPQPSAAQAAAARRFALRVEGPEDFTLEGFYEQDMGRR